MKSSDLFTVRQPMPGGALTSRTGRKTHGRVDDNPPCGLRRLPEEAGRDTASAAMPCGHTAADASVARVHAATWWQHWIYRLVTGRWNSARDNLMALLENLPYLADWIEPPAENASLFSAAARPGLSRHCRNQATLERPPAGGWKPGTGRLRDHLNNVWKQTGPQPRRLHTAGTDRLAYL